jgi:hypothetical protein
MKRAWPIAVLIATLAVAGLCDASAAVASASTPQAQHVTIILAPYLTWDDVSAASTPNLWRMAEKGSIGAVNARSRTRESGQPASPIEGALWLSAGAWVQPDFSAMAAYNARETVVASQTAEIVYRRIFGRGMDGAQMAYLGLPSTQQLNDAKSLDVVLGSLGQAVRDANGLTAAVGNSDAGLAEVVPRPLRPAAVVAMDRRGLVRFGDVSAGLLKSKPDAPYGVGTDLERFESVYAAADNYAKGHKGPSLVVLDSGDLTRARRAASQATPSVQLAQWSSALKTLDAVVGMAQKRAAADGMVIVVSQALYSSADGAPGGLGPIVVSGAGWSGYLTSSSTHRLGVVTNADVTATALEAMGVRRPIAVLGDSMVPAVGPASLDQRASRLSRGSDAAVAIDAPKSDVLNFFIGLVAIALGAAAVVISRSDVWSSATVRRSASVVQALLLLALSFPLAGWLMFLPTPLPKTPEVAVLSLLGTAAMVWILSIILWRRSPMRVPVAALSLALTSVMALDQVFGAPLSAVGFFSYSPLLAARFYGMGNEAAALFFGSAVVGVALLLDQWPESRLAAIGRRWGLLALGFVVVGVAAAPFLGANVGVAVWGLAGFACAWMLVNRRRFSVRSVLVIVGIAVLAIAAFSAIDLLGGGQQTHLGRALSSAGQGGLSQLWMIVVRKTATNIRVFTSTNWSWILVAVLAFLGFARLRPSSKYPELAAENPAFVAAVAATLLAGVIALLTEDSGIVIPSLIMLYTGTGTAWLMLARLDNPDSEEIT